MTLSKKRKKVIRDTLLTLLFPKKEMDWLEKQFKIEFERYGWPAYVRARKIVGPEFDGYEQIRNSVTVRFSDFDPAVCLPCFEYRSGQQIWITNDDGKWFISMDDSYIGCMIDLDADATSLCGVLDRIGIFINDRKSTAVCLHNFLEGCQSEEDILKAFPILEGFIKTMEKEEAL